MMGSASRIVKLGAAILAFSTIVGCAGAPPPQPGGQAAPASTPILPWSSSGAKIGYIRSDVISQKLPEYRDADNTLRNENAQWTSEAERMESDIRTKEAELEELRLILGDVRRKELEDELTNARKAIQKYRQETWYDENSKYLKRRRELMEPVDARINDAIYKVAEMQGLDIVLDTVAGNVVFAKPGLDITERVLEELQR